jgi:hypothetical protein
MALAQLNSNATDSISLSDAKCLIEVDLGYLLSGMPSPAKIYVFEKNQFQTIFQKGELIGLTNLSQIRNEFFSTGFVHESEYEAWDSFRTSRYLRTTKLEILSDEPQSLKSRKFLPHESFRNTYVSYAFSSILLKLEREIEQKRLDLCNQFFRKVVLAESIEWYFDKKDLEPIEKHGARTAYLSLLFSSFSLPRMSLESLETLLHSAILHQLSGDPSSASGTLGAIPTLESIKTKGHTISEKIVNAIREHDERYNGRGAPRGLVGDQINLLARIFTVVNLFDHTYLRMQASSRRLRMEQTITWLQEQKLAFDPNILARFLAFIAKLEVKE